MRNWLDTDAAQFSQTQILVASDGLPRIELFNEGKMIDTIPVPRFNRDEMNELLEELGQPRNRELTWEKIEAEKKLADAFATNNFGAYASILAKEEEDRRQEEL